MLFLINKKRLGQKKKKKKKKKPFADNLALCDAFSNLRTAEWRKVY
jgi:hypothetical protein